jgi:hypothetical protein
VSNKESRLGRSIDVGTRSVGALELSQHNTRDGNIEWRATTRGHGVMHVGKHAFLARPGGNTTLHGMASPLDLHDGIASRKGGGTTTLDVIGASVSCQR